MKRGIKWAGLGLAAGLVLIQFFQPEKNMIPVDPAHDLLMVAEVPKHLAGQSVLAAVALAVQARANVQIDNRVHPLSLFCLTIGESGERKSGADYQALKPHREWERQQHKEAREEAEAYHNEGLIFEKQGKNSFRAWILRIKLRKCTECRSS